MANELEILRSGISKALESKNGHISESTFEYPANAAENIVVIKVGIESMTGKQSG